MYTTISIAQTNSTRIDTRIDTRLLLEQMAGTFVVAPNAFELVGDPVPTAQHWLTLTVRPYDFTGPPNGTELMA